VRLTRRTCVSPFDSSWRAANLTRGLLHTTPTDAPTRRVHSDFDAPAKCVLRCVLLRKPVPAGADFFTPHRPRVLELTCGCVPNGLTAITPRLPDNSNGCVGSAPARRRVVDQKRHDGLQRIQNLRSLPVFWLGPASYRRNTSPSHRCGPRDVRASGGQETATVSRSWSQPKKVAVPVVKYVARFGVGHVWAKDERSPCPAICGSTAENRTRRRLPAVDPPISEPRGEQKPDQPPEIEPSCRPQAGDPALVGPNWALGSGSTGFWRWCQAATGGWSCSKTPTLANFRSTPASKRRNGSSKRG
jgi:hypothetical protein